MAIFAFTRPRAIVSMRRPAPNTPPKSPAAQKLARIREVGPKVAPLDSTEILSYLGFSKFNRLALCATAPRFLKSAVTLYGGYSP